MILALFSCAGEVESPLADDWPAIPAMVTRKTEVPAKFPTDLLVRPDGAVWVLDGYRSAIVPIGADGTSGAPLTGDWGQPVRLANAADGRVWLVDPAGRLVEIDSTGAVRAVVPLAGTLDVEEGGGPPRARSRRWRTAPRSSSRIATVGSRGSTRPTVQFSDR